MIIKLEVGNLELKCYVSLRTQILFYLEGLMTHMGNLEFHSVSVSHSLIIRKSWYKVKESTALIKFRLS